MQNTVPEYIGETCRPSSEAHLRRLSATAQLPFIVCRREVLCWLGLGHQQRHGTGPSRRAERYCGHGQLSSEDTLPYRVFVVVRLHPRRRLQLPLQLPVHILPAGLLEAGRRLVRVEQDNRQQGVIWLVVGGVALHWQSFILGHGYSS